VRNVKNSLSDLLTMSLISRMQMKAVVVVHIDKLLYYYPELNYVVIESMESTS